MLNILRKGLERHAELPPLIIVNVRILTPGEAVTGGKQFDVRCVVIIFLKFSDTQLHYHKRDA